MLPKNSRLNFKSLMILSLLAASWLWSAQVWAADPPTNPYPKNGATNVLLTPTLQWSAVPGADSYSVQVSTSPNFEDSKIVWSYPYVIGNSYVLPTGYLNYDTTYYWRVSANVESWFLIKTPADGAVIYKNFGETVKVPIIVCSNQLFDYASLRDHSGLSFKNVTWIGRTDIAGKNDPICGPDAVRKWEWSWDITSLPSDEYQIRAHNTEKVTGGDLYHWIKVQVQNVGGDTWQCGDPIKYEGGPYYQDGSVRNQRGYYRTVEIDGDCWFRDNLNVGTMIERSTRSQQAKPDEDQNPTNNVIEKYCLNNTEAECLKNGGLYQALEALQTDMVAVDDYCHDDRGCLLTNTIFRGICPAGWHVPTADEAKKLALNHDYQDVIVNGSTKLDLILAGTANGFYTLPFYKSGQEPLFGGQGNTDIVWAGNGDIFGKNFYSIYADIIHTVRPQGSTWGDDPLYYDTPESIYTAGVVRCVKDKSKEDLLGAKIWIDSPADLAVYDPSQADKNVLVAMPQRSDEERNIVKVMVKTNKNFGEVELLHESGNPLFGTTTLISRATNGGEFVFYWDITGLPAREYKMIARAEYGGQTITSPVRTVLVQREENATALGCPDLGKVVQWPGGQRLADGNRAADLQGGYYGLAMMPDGKCWFTENLNVGQQVDKSNPNKRSLEGLKYCYDNNNYYCLEFGGLYHWSNLVDYGAHSADYTEKGQGYCPAGFHVPGIDEISKLVASVTGSSDLMPGGQTEFNNLIPGNGSIISSPENTYTDGQDNEFYNGFTSNGTRSDFWSSNLGDADCPQKYAGYGQAPCGQSLYKFDRYSLGTVLSITSNTRYSARCVADFPASLVITDPLDQAVIYFKHDNPNKEVPVTAIGLAKNDFPYTGVDLSVARQEDNFSTVLALNTSLASQDTWQAPLTEAVVGHYTIEATGLRQSETVKSAPVHFEVKYYPYCGDGHKDNPNDEGQDEECDGEDFGDIKDLSCNSYLGKKNYVGEIKCTDCRIDTSACQPGTIIIKDPTVYPYNIFNPDKDSVVQFEVWSNVDRNVYIRNKDNEILNTVKDASGQVLSQEIIIAPMEARHGNVADGWTSFINWTINKRVGEYGFVRTGIYDAMAVFQDDVTTSSGQPTPADQLESKSNIAPITIIRNANLVLSSENGTVSQTADGLQHYKFDLSKPAELTANLKVDKNVQFDDVLTVFIKRKVEIENDTLLEAPKRGQVTPTVSKFDWNLEPVDPDVWLVQAYGYYQGDPVYSNQIEVELYYPEPVLTITQPINEALFYLPPGQTMVSLIDILGESTRNYFQGNVFLDLWVNSLDKVSSTAVFGSAGINKYKYNYTNVSPGVYWAQARATDKIYGALSSNQVKFTVLEPVCGNGIVEGSEECDEGDKNNDQGTCNTKCEITYCGDAVKQEPNGRKTLGPKNNGYEDCDGADFGSKNSCAAWLDPTKKYKGAIKCLEISCTVDTSACQVIPDPKCGSLYEQKPFASEPAWDQAKLCDAGDPSTDPASSPVKPIYVVDQRNADNNYWTWSCSNEVGSVDCRSYHKAERGCAIYTSGGMLGLPILKPDNVGGVPYNFVPPFYELTGQETPPAQAKFYNTISSGSYINLDSVFRNTSAYSLDGLAVDAHTKLEIWRDKNGFGRNLPPDIVIVGPTVVDNFDLWADRSSFWSTKDYNLRNCFGLDRMEWPNCQTVQTIGFYDLYSDLTHPNTAFSQVWPFEGSMRITCGDFDQGDYRLNGACGEAITQTFSKAPTKDDLEKLCQFTSSSYDTVASIKDNGNGTWTWTCYGANGGSDTSCTSKEKDAVCGNGVKEKSEECDDGQYNSDQGRCNKQCKLTYCGDNVLQSPNGKQLLGQQQNGQYGYEDCDGTDFGGKNNCADWLGQGYTGTVTCQSSCLVDTSGCQKIPDPICGNGLTEQGEECDDGASNSDQGRCNKQCKLTYCGDNVLQSPNGKQLLGQQQNGQYGYEDCDGTDFGGKNNCADWLGQGYTGTVTCQSSCLVDTSGCQALLPICGAEYNGKTYQAEPTWNFGLLCDLGSPFPTPPSFDENTNTWSWTCVYNFRTVSCQAHYEPQLEDDIAYDCGALAWPGGPRNSQGVMQTNRNGGYYGTVKLGEQCWFTDSLNAGSYVVAPNGQNNTPNIVKYCYNNNIDNCLPYGGLYEYDNYRYRDNTCPDGWRVPKYKEYLHAEYEMRKNSDLFNNFKITQQYAGLRRGTEPFRFLNSSAFLMITGCDAGLCSAQCYSGKCDYILFSIDNNTAQSIRCVEDKNLPNWKGICGTSNNTNIEPKEYLEHCDYTGFWSKASNKTYHADTQSWSWVCYGDDASNDNDNLVDGDDVLCSTTLNPVLKKGQCGPLDQSSQFVLPEQTIANFSQYCTYSSAGYTTTYGSLTGLNDDQSEEWTWKCYGDNILLDSNDYVLCKAKKLKLVLTTDKDKFDLNIPDQIANLDLKSNFDMWYPAIKAYYMKDLNDRPGTYAGNSYVGMQFDPLRQYDSEWPINEGLDGARQPGFLRFEGTGRYYVNNDPGNSMLVKSNEVIIELTKNALPKNGVCSTQQIYLIKPNPTTDNLCSTGTAKNVRGHADSFRVWKYTDKDSPWQWTCSGQAGGRDTDCPSQAPYLSLDFEAFEPVPGLFGNYQTLGKEKKYDQQLSDTNSPWTGVRSFRVDTSNTGTMNLTVLSNVSTDTTLTNGKINSIGLREVKKDGTGNLGFIDYFTYDGAIGSEFQWSINNWDYTYSADKEPNKEIAGKKLTEGKHYLLAYALTDKMVTASTDTVKNAEVYSEIIEIDVAAAEPTMVCGNGVAEGEAGEADYEECDGSDLRGQTCRSFFGGCYTGTPRCNSQCKLTTTGCSQSLKAPQLYKPDNDAVNQPASIKFQWYKPGTGSGCYVPDGYHIQVAKGTDFAASDMVHDKYVNSTADLIDTTLNNFSLQTDYYWRVQARRVVNGSSVLGDWSAIWHFSGETLLPPELVAPANNSVVSDLSKLEFEWKLAQGAEYGYRGEVSTDPDDFLGGNVEQFTSASPTKTKYQPSLSRFKNNITYYWRMQSLKTFTQRSDFSETWEFTPTKCGDDFKHAKEECDRVGGQDDFGGKTCADYGFTGGVLTCNSCKIDTSRCTTCGNGVIEAPYEDCEGLNLNGQTCASLGYANEGILKCSSQCKFDGSNCRDICDYGDGGDGDATIWGNKNINTDTIGLARNCADGISYQVDDLGLNSAILFDRPNPIGRTCLATGDLVVLINLQGTNFSFSQPGNYEILQIQSVNNYSQTVTFTTNIADRLTRYGNSLGRNSGEHRVMIQRIPRYRNLTISPGAVLTANAWNGQTGGVLAFDVSQDFVNNGKVDVSALGYRGGPHDSNYPRRNGYGGEGLKGGYLVRLQGNDAVGPQPFDPMNPYSGAAGVGTEDWCSGGGGGGGYASDGQNGCLGEGNTPPNGMPSDLPCEYQSNGSACEYYDGHPSGIPGVGGKGYGSKELKKIFMGSGGGAGGQDDYSTSVNNGSGGNGGGIILINAKTTDNNGTITADGQKGENSPRGGEGGSGGGGAGGTILLTSCSASLGNMTANYGLKGISPVYLGNQTSGHGGNGSYGRIAIRANEITDNNLSAPAPFTRNLGFNCQCR